MPHRFERVVEVTPEFPKDVIAALGIHTAQAEKRAGHPLFEAIDWSLVVAQHREPSTGDWIHGMHAVLRRKARREAAGESPRLITTSDLMEETRRFTQAAHRLAVPAGNYV
jgi:hypothetical protein